MKPFRVALITGSGKRRVGWYVAEALARAGYALALHYRSSEQEAKETQHHFRSGGANVALFQADLAAEPQVKGMFEQVMDCFGRIDVLVNCAAIWERKKLE